MTSRDRAARLAVAVAGFAGAVYFALLVQLFFTGIDGWEMAGVSVRLRPWSKPLWIGVGFWLLALGLARQAPWPVGLVSRMAGRVAAAVGIERTRPGMAWAVLGGFLGALLAFLLSTHFRYLLPAVDLRIGLAAVGFGAGAGLHLGFDRRLERGLARWGRGASEWRRTALKLGAYLVALAVLLTWPAHRWEAMGTEPAVAQVFQGSLLGGVLLWAFLAKWRGPGPRGMARRSAVPVLAVAAVAVGVYSVRVEALKRAPDGPGPDRVLLVTLDTTRADFLSCYGYPRLTSPNLDALAASGARFTRAFCPRGETDPAHASMLTGAYPRTHGLLTNYQPVAGKVGSLAREFQKRGYLTLAITSRSHLDPMIMNIPGFDDVSAPSLAAQDTSAFDAWRRLQNKLVEYRDRDVFIWLHFFDPHGSYVPHPGVSDQFLEQNRGPYVGKKVLKQKDSIPPEEIKYARDLYAGEIFYMDYYLGKCLDLVRTLSPAPRRPPFVLAIADHGESLGDYADWPARYAFGHGGVLYNASARVPLIVAWPGTIKPGTVIAEIAETIDVAATMLDFCLDGATFANQGLSLRPAIVAGAPTDGLAVMQRGRSPESPNPYFHQNQWGVIKDDLKLIIADDGSIELFELLPDGAEQANIAPARPDLAKPLIADLTAWLEAVPECKVQQRPQTMGEISVLKALGYIQ